mmetsp:Transcript_11755/g.28535  ORF Transcript_11755/g.28535 Transcript_11755/m.28535 type:complete len:308 (-) Transcript_11755:62-985(-)
MEPLPDAISSRPLKHHTRKKLRYHCSRPVIPISLSGASSCCCSFTHSSSPCVSSPGSPRTKTTPYSVSKCGDCPTRTVHPAHSVPPTTGKRAAQCAITPFYCSGPGTDSLRLGADSSATCSRLADAAARMPCDPRRPPGGAGGLSARFFGVRLLALDGVDGAGPGTFPRFRGVAAPASPSPAAFVSLLDASPLPPPPAPRGARRNPTFSAPLPSVISCSSPSSYTTAWRPLPASNPRTVPWNHSLSSGQNTRTFHPIAAAPPPALSAAAALGAFFSAMAVSASSRRRAAARSRFNFSVRRTFAAARE